MIEIGQTASVTRPVDPLDIEVFALNSGDTAPRHIGKGGIAHGAYQIGLASGMMGTTLPGPDYLLVSVQATFLNPLRFPSVVTIDGKITAWDYKTQFGTLTVLIHEVDGPNTAIIVMRFKYDPFDSNQ